VANLPESHKKEALFISAVEMSFFRVENVSAETIRKSYSCQGIV
jgi:hypothetical protein